MKTGPASATILKVLVLINLSSCITKGALYQDKANRYLGAVRKFADIVLQHGTDTYGAQSPLFVDGLHATTLQPARWRFKDETWVLCNFASQQPLMRALDGLSTLVSEEKYRRGAEDAARYALGHLTTPNGLLYWGGHLAWDLEKGGPVGQYGDVHELKNHRPYYRLMWRVDASAARKLAETIWAGHIIDWERLDYNRHASIKKALRPDWSHRFEENPEVPFPAQGGNLSFANVTPPLMHSGVMLAVLGEDTEALRWTSRLIRRWQQAKDSRTGLSGGQLSFRRQDRAKDALGHVHPEINEAKIVASYHQTGRYHSLPLAQMQDAVTLIDAGGEYAKVGRKFLQWASDDLNIYGRHSYDPKTGRFVGLMTDGTRIKWTKSRSGYYVPESFAPRRPDGLILWSYALAYRLTGERTHWQMLRRLGQRLDLGDIGQTDGAGRSLNFDTERDDWRILYAVLDMARATEDRRFMRLACRIGDNMLRLQSGTGLFARRGRAWARTGDEIPLALLHLAAAILGKESLMPQPAFDSRFFHCEYHGPLEEHQKKRADKRTYDNLVFYGGS
ncbi:MAG: hypothetical protein JSU94_08670 [Phycisphaerales bacterium]|nr:MAG: hypothetical protein JSU94_08670 [Phycisphaerales bacterium]